MIRLLPHGNALKHLSNLDRFWTRVDRTGGPDACWPWVAGRFANGYGSFRVDGRNARAHRWLLGHLRGEALGADELGCHHCDNPPCCNPRHLFIGSHGDNTRDMTAKGRHRSQVKTHCPKGHEYTADNTYTHEGHRKCRQCVLERMRIPGAVVPGERTHCPRGHAYDEANTYVTKGGTRDCRACGAAKARERRERRRAETA